MSKSCKPQSYPFSLADLGLQAQQAANASAMQAVKARALDRRPDSINLFSQAALYDGLQYASNQARRQASRMNKSSGLQRVLFMPMSKLYSTVLNQRHRCGSTHELDSCAAPKGPKWIHSPAVFLSKSRHGTSHQIQQALFGQKVVTATCCPPARTMSNTNVVDIYVLAIAC